ncbi:hypothetical protein [Actinoplanes sp. DH11]|uniref:hypothetical protein n=1 Tax=Actinoplanes sp. DH11 TaxID=2857011 RepID=UPI001E3E26E5|nr:hypothetical protein [Actinoplanes sp. DH11]
MTDNTNRPEDSIEHGAAEDATGTPVTPTDVETSRRPASEPADAGDDDRETGRE